MHSVGLCYEILLAKLNIRNATGFTLSLTPNGSFPSTRNSGRSIRVGADGLSRHGLAHRRRPGARHGQFGDEKRRVNKPFLVR